MRVAALFASLCALVFVACNSSTGDSNASGNLQTVQLKANGDGTLGYCDAAGTCANLPNPDNCKTLTISIDTTSGQACQVCTAADGTDSAKNCSSPAVACQVVTIPNPHCVVCAYVNGTVIYSSCQPSAPTCYTANADGTFSSSGSSGSGSAGPGTQTTPNGDASSPTDPGAAPQYDVTWQPTPPAGCTICIDQNGNRVSQDCPPSCELVDCPKIGCGSGYQMVTTPGDCCGHCEPIMPCAGAMCAMPFPNCPDGQIATKDPTQCCGWYCEPVSCDTVLANGTYACPMIAVENCAPGYVWSTEAPHCCGACVPAADTQE